MPPPKKDRPSLKRFLKTIPSVPKGKRFHIEILSNWGDKHYVGLTGIELFNDKGQRLEVDPERTGYSLNGTPLISQL